MPGIRFLDEPSLINPVSGVRYQFAGSAFVAVRSVAPGALTRHTASEAVLVTPGSPAVENFWCRPEAIEAITGLDEDGDPVCYATSYDGLEPVEGEETDVAVWAVTETTYPHPSDGSAHHAEPDEVTDIHV